MKSEYGLKTGRSKIVSPPDRGIYLFNCLQPDSVISHYMNNQQNFILFKYIGFIETCLTLSMLSSDYLYASL